VGSPEGQLRREGSAEERGAEIFWQACQKGVRLWLDHGKLHYSGALSQEEIARLKTCRSQIIAFLRVDQESSPSSGEVRSQRARAPLTLVQLQHWNVFQLYDRPSMRRTTSVTRLQGRLDLGALRQSLTAVVRRHDALRSRVILSDAVPLQEISEPGPVELQVIDVAPAPEPLRDVEIQQRIDEVMLQPIDVASDPLFSVTLLRLEDTEHLLVLATDHIISDARSMSIFLRDLLFGYVHVLSSHAIFWSEEVCSFADYARRQCSALPTRLEAHGRYWSERLMAAGRLRFPPDTERGDPRPGWGRVTFHIDKDVKAALRAWCRLRHTTLVMSIFTACAAAVLRWCNTSSGVIQYLWEGRTTRQEENTIGDFASTLYLRMELTERYSFLELLDQAMKEYYNAHEHADFSYIESRSPRPEVARSVSFNWIPPAEAGIELAELTDSEYALQCAPVPWEDPTLADLEREQEPMIEFRDSDTDVLCHLSFPQDRFTTASMERFGHHILRLILTMLENPGCRVRDVVLP
jgi:hypothetical protein